MKQALQKPGYAVNHLASGDSALHAVKVARPDIVILNIGLSDIDGIAVLKKLRLTDKSLPVLLLTARDGVADEVAGLDRGAMIIEGSVAQFEQRD